MVGPYGQIIDSIPRKIGLTEPPNVSISRRLERVQVQQNGNAVLPLSARKIVPIQPVALHAVLGRPDDVREQQEMVTRVALLEHHQENEGDWI
jgi:hypothetical protein